MFIIYGYCLALAFVSSKIPRVYQIKHGSLFCFRGPLRAFDGFNQSSGSNKTNKALSHVCMLVFLAHSFDFVT